MLPSEISALIAEASSYKDKAYVPYSHFPVCALIIDSNGRKHFGVNVENASYGLTVCAERNALAGAVTQGLKDISLIVIAAEGSPVSPCGACRQVLAEFASPDTPVICAGFDGAYQQYTMGFLLPQAFTNKSLPLK